MLQVHRTCWRWDALCLINKKRENLHANMASSWWCVLSVLCVLIDVCVAQETCYPPGGVAGIVVATIIVTFVAGAMGTAVAYKLWTRKKGHTFRDRVDGQHQKTSQKPNEFAFDNPYFRDPEANDVDQADKGKERSSMNNKNSLRSSKLSELSSKGKKPRSGKNHFMFGGGGGKKHRALDDSCLSVEPERTIVSLRGHDFTGLGFNICGNMRDGILVKDVLHRGPASESGLIKAGDKIVNVTVSFTNIVYEDALTILSYASPYDVQLEIERVPDKSRHPHAHPLPPNTPSGSKRLGSCSFNSSGQKLFHPLYRSQSIDDLTQIDNSFPAHGLGPRRSQSVGVAAHKLAAHFKNSDSKLEENNSKSSVMLLSTTGSLNEKMLANVMADGNLNKNGLQWEKRFEDTLESEDDSTNNNDTQLTQLDASKLSSKSILKVGRPSNNDSSSEDHGYKQKYLDSPHQRGKLETFKTSSDKKNESPMASTESLRSGRAKTMAEASSALWHLDQSIKEGDVSIGEFERSRNAAWNESKRDEMTRAAARASSTPKNGGGNNKYAKRDDGDNDSDVSNDSLELSNKKRGNNKKGKKLPNSTHSGDDVKGMDSKSHKQGYHQQKASKKGEAKAAKGNKTEVSSYGNNSERVYANNIMNKNVSSLHNSDDQKGQGSERGSYPDLRDTKQHVESHHHGQTDSNPKQPPTVYANHRDLLQEAESGGRNTQKIVINNESSSNNYGKVMNGRSAAYGERQKLNSPENYSQNYGCTNRITVNGDSSDDNHKGKFSSANNKAASYSQQQKNAAPSHPNYPTTTATQENNDTDTRYLDKNKSNAAKFVKKSAHPAGMFTQINPFQQPARASKNASFKIWTGSRGEECGLNGGDSGGYSNSTYISCDSSNQPPSSSSNRRDYLGTESPPNYGQSRDVSKTVLISSYDSTSGRSSMGGGAQNSPLNYRSQHK